MCMLGLCLLPWIETIYVTPLNVFHRGQFKECCGHLTVLAIQATQFWAVGSVIVCVQYIGPVD